MKSDLHVFVYGTLKRGQCRENAWPRVPVSVFDAWVLGELYDLGDYPALVPGSERVVGEVWTIPSQDVDATLRVLDEIEGYRNQPNDLYRRDDVDCWAMGATRSFRALTYLYARPLAEQLKVCPNSQGECIWPQVMV